MTTTSQADTEAAPSPTSEMRRTFLNPEYDIVRRVLDTQRTNQFYANPYGRRISEYEQVLLYAQPNPDWIPGGLSSGGWTNRFPGGRGAWENYFTEMKSSDWFAFRDPGQRWQVPYVRQKAEEWEETQRLVRAYDQEQLYRDIDEEWLTEVLPSYYGAMAHHEYGLFQALGPAIRDALADMIRVAVITGAMDHLDNAEMIQAEKVYLANAMDRFSPEMAPATAVWTSDPVYVGARHNVERMMASVYDHMEAIFAIFMVHEPLFGRYARQQYFQRAAAFHGDQLTPAVMWGTITGFELDAQWCFELFARVLGKDPKFGQYNQRVMRLWAKDWLGESIAAMRDFAPMFTKTARCRAAMPADAATQAAYTVLSEWQRRYAPVFGLEVDVDALVAAATRS